MVQVLPLHFGFVDWHAVPNHLGVQVVLHGPREVSDVNEGGAELLGVRAERKLLVGAHGRRHGLSHAREHAQDHDDAHEEREPRGTAEHHCVVVFWGEVASESESLLRLPLASVCV